MLDAFIIDQLRKEREKEQWEPVPLHLPIPIEERPNSEYDKDQDGDSNGGIMIIDVFNDDEQAARHCDYGPALNYKL